MLTKTKRLLAVLLCSILLLGLLSACGGTQQEILPDVKDALDIDEAAEKQINEMFEAFDSAFETLAKNKQVTNADFQSYAEAVDEADEKVKELLDGKNDLLSEKIDKTEDKEKKEALLMIMLENDFVLASSKLDIALLWGTEEESAEAAFALVNAYNNFFYGADRITDKDTDSIDYVEADTLLPFGLQFGDTYDACAEKHEMPELKPASNNDGYFCSGDYSLRREFFNGFSWEDDIIAIMPMLAYSFNEDHLLYEYYYITKFSSENEAERAFNSLKDWLADQLGAAPNVTENGKLVADFSTSELGSSITLEQLDDGAFRLYVVLHSIPYDLEH